MICPNCNSIHTKKKGIRRGQQRHKCKVCDKQFTTPLSVDQYTLPRILLLDIETSGSITLQFGFNKQYITTEQIIGHEFILCWAAKWLYDEDVFSDAVTPAEAKERNDQRILQSIWKLLDQAEIVIGHNVKEFDIRKLNWRFLNHKIPPPTPYSIIDTLQFARKEFYAPSFKQGFLTKHLNKHVKHDTDISLWKNCNNGIEEALHYMLQYNRNDVIGLEDVYLEIRPYIKSHPNLAVMMDSDVCTHCGSGQINETESYYYTSAYRYPVYRCEVCKTPNIRHKSNANNNKINLRPVAG